MSNNQYSFYSSVSRHILKDKYSDKIPSNFYFYPYHFPTALLNWINIQPKRVSIAKPLTHEEAKSIDKNYLSTQRFFDNSNSILCYQNIDVESTNTGRIKLSEDM